MTVAKITGRNNPLLKSIRLVSAGSHRAPKELVAVEGVRVLEEATKAGFPFEAVVLSERFGIAEREKSLLAAWQSGSVRTYSIGEKLFESLSSVQTSQGAIALVRVPEPGLNDIAPAENMLILCACGIQDPGNLGTLIRAAAAAGAHMVCTTRGTVSARNPKVLRSSAGAFFHIPVVEHVETADLQAFCNARSIRLYRSDARSGVSYTVADLRSSCAIMLGNEGSGMPEEQYAGYPAIRISMAEGIESLNVAMAGTIILFEAFRQRTGC